MGTIQTSVGVIGLGYVGLPLALAMANVEYNVIGVDVDQQAVAKLREGESNVESVSAQDVAKGLDNGFKPTTDYEALCDVDAVSICVPTPLRKTGNPDVSYIVDAVERIREVITADTTVILESTVYPGATQELIVPELERENWVIGEDIFVAFSPERIDPGNKQYKISDIPKVIGGITPSCFDHAKALYTPVFDEVVGVESAIEAELVKLLENTFRAVNIGLVNEMAMITHQFNVDIWNVIEAASTKPFGYMPFYPGPGLGGHCLPIDPLLLSWKANQRGIETQSIDLAEKINRKMPKYVVQRIINLLNKKGKLIKNTDILVVGVAYKPDVSDTRESPARDVISALEDNDANIIYHDPHVPSLKTINDKYKSVSLNQEVISSAGCVLLLTNHSDIDYQQLLTHAELIFDTRGELNGQNENVYRL